MFSGAVSCGLCDLDRVSGGGETDVSVVDTVVSGAVSGWHCDLDGVSRGDLVVRVGEMSLSGGGDAVVSGVDEFCVLCQFGVGRWYPRPEWC